MNRLRVHFDQNCMNAKGTHTELQRVRRLHDTGEIQLVASRRHDMELKDDSYGARARVYLLVYPRSSESLRWAWSATHWGDHAAIWGKAANSICARAVWEIVFGRHQLPPSVKAIYNRERINSLHDVMRIVDAHEDGADVFLTRDRALLNARETLYSELGLRPRIESPAEFLLRFPPSPETPL